MELYDVIIIGGGPGGLSAAYSAYRNGAKKILVIERDRELGGILQQCIHNGFGLHHFKEELTVNDLAEHFYMDKNTLTRQFKRIIGMTPGDYIRRKRLETAHALIRQGYSVLNAGYSSGFSDYSAFYRAFCHLYGQAPSTFSSQTRKTGRRRTATESEE